MTKIGFLHFTDLHFGMSGLAERWPTVRAALFEDLDEINEEAGPWDLVIFTGDFAGRGDRKEDFGNVRVALEELAAHLRDLSSEPRLVAVPGNHDLARPPPEDPAALVLQHLWGQYIWGRHNTVAGALFENSESEYRGVVDRAFANYCEWLEDPGMPVLEPTARGLLPGDYSTTHEKEGVRLGLLGVNTAFLQLSDKMTEGSLAVDTRQLQGACAGDVPRWAAGHDACLLLTHHPTSWLRKEARDTLMQDVLQVTGSSFALHLCGHLHEPSMIFKQAGDAAPTRLLQGASLFGREEYGPNDEQRIHGYSACQLDFAEKTISVWPRIAEQGDGRLFLRPDSKIIQSTRSMFKWTMGESVEALKGRPSLPPELDAALSRQVTIFKRDLRYEFTVLDVTEHEMTAELELSYELVNVAPEPQLYDAGLQPDRPTEYIAASWGDAPVDTNDSRYRAGDYLIFPVRLPPTGSVPVCVKARVTYGVPDSEVLTTYVPSLDYELALKRHRSLRLLVQWQTTQQGDWAEQHPNIDMYTATEPVLQNQGLKLSWMLNADGGSGS